MTQCPSCKADLPSGTRFCTSCGQPVPATGPAVSPDAKTVTASAAAGATTPADGEKTEMVIPAGVKAAPDQATEMMTRATPADSPAPSAAPAAAPAGGVKDDISKIFETSGVCPNCYATLKKGAGQCDECGYRLTGTFCPRCNTQLPDDAKSCPNCKWSETSPGTWAPGVTAVPVSAGTVPPGTVPPGTVPPGPAIGQTVMTPPPAAPAIGQAVAGGASYAPPPAAPVTGQSAYAAPPTAPAAAPAARKGFPIVLVLVIGLFLIGILGVGGWFGWRYWQQRQAATTTGTEGPGAPDGTASTGESQTGGADATIQGFGADAGADASLLQQAQTYFDSGDYARALAKVQQHLQDNPGDATAHALAGQACRALGQPDDAIRHFQSALSIQPDNGALRLELGKLYTSGGFSGKAIENFREAVRLLPGNPEPQWCLVQELQKSGDAESARREAEQYVTRHPAGPNRGDADALLAQGQRPRGGRTGGAAVGDSSSGSWTGAATGGQSGASSSRVEPPPPPPPPPPSPYVTVILDGSALNLPGKVAEVTVSFAGIQQRFTSSATARLDNVEKGSHAYNVVVTYILPATGEKEFTYSGSGTLMIRYQDQKIRVRRIGERILMD